MHAIKECQDKFHNGHMSYNSNADFTKFNLFFEPAQMCDFAKIFVDKALGKNSLLGTAFSNLLASYAMRVKLFPASQFEEYLRCLKDQSAEAARKVKYYKKTFPATSKVIDDFFETDNRYSSFYDNSIEWSLKFKIPMASTRGFDEGMQSELAGVMILMAIKFLHSKIKKIH